MIDNPKLPWCDTRNGDIRNDIDTSVGEMYRAQSEFRLMTDLETHALTFRKTQCRIHQQHVAERNKCRVLRNRVVALRHIYDVVRNVFLHHKPRSAAQAKAFPLANGMEPEALVTTKFLACFQLDDIARHFAQVFTDIIVVVDFSQEANSLTVMPLLGFTDDLSALVLVYQAVKNSVTPEITAQADAKLKSWFA